MKSYEDIQEEDCLMSPAGTKRTSQSSYVVAVSFRKAILSAFLLLCSHGKKNDTAMLRKFLRKVLGISLRLRKSLRKVLGIRSTNGW